MPRIHPLHLFPPHIAERGLLYFQQGKVRDVQKTSAGRYRAEVSGSENYWVWLKLDSDLYIKDGGCDCPYGGACKHMAALWYAVRAETPDGQPDEPGVQQPEIIIFVSCSNTKGYLKTIFQVAFLSLQPNYGASRSLIHLSPSRRYWMRSCRRLGRPCQNSTRSGISR